MSASQEIEFTCPYCGKPFEITIYNSVNAKQDPDLRERAISGDLFTQTCPHCHKAMLVKNSLLYSDPEHKFVIVLSEDKVPNSVSLFLKPLLNKGYKIRRCATIEEFSEKIQIFEDGMDDVMVELAKYDSFIEFINNREGNPEDVTSVEYQNTNNDVMKINVRTGDRGMGFLIPVAMVEEEMKAEADLLKVNDASFPCINREWIISVFEKVSAEA